MEILYLDDQIIVCSKPSGVLSEGEGADCLPTLLSEHLSEHGEQNTKIFPVHRLDRETSGVMVFARTSKAAASLCAQITDGEFKKQYLALVHGTPDTPTGAFSDLLYYDRRLGKSFAVDRERKGVKHAELDYEVLSSKGGLTLVRVRLHTGRTHQIRVQFASRGMPLAGDRRYGAPKSNFRRIALHSHTLSFSHPKSGEALTFKSDIEFT